MKSLTINQLQVLDKVAEGKSNREIAKAFNLSVYAIKATMTRIFNNLGVDNRVEAIMSYKLNQTEGVTVSTDNYWIDINTCPSSKVLLLTIGGIAVIGRCENKANYLGWYPLPKIPRGMRK